MSSFNIRGQKELIRFIKKMENWKEFVDGPIKKTALNSNARLKKTTQPKASDKKWPDLKGGRKGSTRQAWGAPVKVGTGTWANINISKTDDGKHLIVMLINHGRKEVRPVYSKALYIPITGKAKKKYRSPIPPDVEYGKDYIFAKRSKAWKGTKFLNEEIKKAREEMLKFVNAKLDKEMRKK